VYIDQLISKEDPTRIYVDARKIGEGYVRDSRVKSNQYKVAKWLFFPPSLYLISAAGEVFSATNSRTGMKVAVKKMALNGESLKLLITEISIMKTSKHPNIVEYVDSYMVEDQLWVNNIFFLLFICISSKEAVILVLTAVKHQKVIMEFMSGGCLTEVLEQFDYVQMNEGQMAYVCAQV